MSRTGQIPRDEDSPEMSPPPARRRYLRRILFFGSGIALLLVIVIVGLFLWASSSSFENIIRKRIIARIEAGTGGRAEIRSFRWKLLKLEADIDGLTLHGREAQGEAPYAQVDSVHAAISILDLLSPRVLLRDLEVVKPQVHIIAYRDGTTNIPQPRLKSSTSSHPIDTLFDLQAGHVEVQHGLVDFDDRSDEADDFQDRHIPLDFGANDVSLVMRYLSGHGPDPEKYHLDADVHDLHLARGLANHPEAPPVEGQIKASVDLTRNALYFRSVQVTAHSKGSKDRQLNIAGELQDFTHPRWNATAQGELDLKLLEPATGYPSTPEGIARLNLTAQGQQGEFRIDGTVHADNAAYIGTGVVSRGVTLDARVHADPLHLQITNVTARLKQGGQLAGDVLLDHWIAPLSAAPVMVAAAPPKHEKKGRSHEPAAAAPVVHPKPDNLLHTNGKVHAYFRNVALDTVLDLVSSPPFQRLGLATLINGPSVAEWNNGDIDTLSVAAKFKLNPSANPGRGEAPTSGVVDATYLQRTGDVDLRALEVTLPSSHITAHGRLGAYPMTSPTGVYVDLQSHDLGEFDTLFRDLGLTRNGTTGTAALPLSLGGEADFHGTWAGSLLDPHLGGNFRATNFSLEIPAASADTQPRSVHLDSLDLTGSYAAEKIGIDHGQLQHGNAAISLDGTLTAVSATGKRFSRPRFDSNSLLHANVHADKIDAEEIATFLGKSLPLTGTMSARLFVDGPYSAMNGNGWIQLENGSIYGEPLARARADGNIAGQVIQLSSVSLSSEAGAINASGSYDLNTKHFTINARSSSLDVSRLDHLRRQTTGVQGSLGFTLTGSGTLDDPRLEAHATLSSLSVSGEKFGAIAINARTANRSAIYELTSQLEGAELTAHGQTALIADYETKAALNFSRFDIGHLLAALHVSGLTGESNLEGSVNLEGPLAHPDLMRGEARIKDLALTVSGVHLHSDGGLHATMGNSQIKLDPLHITGEQTDVHVQTSVNLAEKRRLDLAANGSINLKLAETIDPDLTASGTTTFRVEAHGPLTDPNLTGRIDFENASLALEDLPNSLSQLHGTLEFNQNRLEVKSLTAMSGGGQLSVTGYLSYQHGLYADLALKGKSIRIRYPQGVSSAADINLQLQGPQSNLLLSGNVMITRFTVSPELDLVALASQTTKSQTIAPADAPSNHIRLDVRIQSSPQLNFQNAYAKLAGDVDLRLRGTLASPSLLGRISITEGSATIAGTRYELQRGEITFTNPVRIQPNIDLNATAHVEDYDITLGLHGSVDQPTVTYRSDPPLPEADVIALLALGRTQDQQRLYTRQQEQLASNPATDALLGGALNATVSSRVQKLFGAGSVKVDPNYLGVLGNSTTRITVEEQLGRNLTLTYATDVDTTAQQLLQAEIAINRHVSLLVARDESGVFSMVVKATRRFR
ncbi:translocation/assembly module TamB domain-containing protein [Occallatibacter savannae]|uniref:translocation/assembly module TamB domain-containing protein n=1 Tax=Occallatibacter savannae TaxID=1002691 RepID=UPI000D697506|nr:translocation/assembly module TamB domain-containing protein [Occallatibacter savannae]